MMTLFLMGLAGTALILGGIPFVLFALMLETCDARQGRVLAGAPLAKSGTRIKPIGFARAA
ncbi:MAG TPA: hypothetical protein VHE30_03460 [Polyangiaceae bacterium]|nr:hypothetical protein [Polyangiaceae bacterium]